MFFSSAKLFSQTAFLPQVLLSGLRLPILMLGLTGFAQAEQVQLPRVMAWTAYNLGTTGYNQAVAIGKVLNHVPLC